MGWNLAAAAAGISDVKRRQREEQMSLEQILFARKLQEAQLQMQQQAAADRQREMAAQAERQAKGDKFAEAGAYAGMLDQMPQDQRNSVDPTIASTMQGTPYALRLQQKSTLPSSSVPGIEALGGQARSDPGGQGYASWTPTQAQLDEQGATNRRASALAGIRQGNPKAGQLIDAGLTPPASLFEPPPESPADAAARRLQEHEDFAKIDARYRPQPSGGGTPDQVWVFRDGKIVPITKGTAIEGDLPQSAATASVDGEAQDTASEVSRIAKALASHPGVRGAFGVVDSRFPTVKQSTADAEVLRDSLMALLTIENMGKMKGVLSDADMRVVRQASTTLSSQMSDSAAIAELKRLAQVMDRALHNRGGAPPPNNPDDQGDNNDLGVNW